MKSAHLEQLKSILSESDLHKNPLPPPSKVRSSAKSLEGLKEAYKGAPIERWIYASALALQHGYDLAASQGWLPDGSDLILDEINYAKKWAVDQDPEAMEFFRTESGNIKSLEAPYQGYFQRYFRDGLWRAPDYRNSEEEQQAYWKDTAQTTLASAADSLQRLVRQSVGEGPGAGLHSVFWQVAEIQKLPPFHMTGRYRSGAGRSRAKIDAADELLGNLLKEVMTGKR